jgi:hypothetical protein
MKNQNVQPRQKREYKPKREPIPRTWFLSHGYTKADTRHTDGSAVWLHPKTNDVFSAYGQIKLKLVPKEKHLKKGARYLYLSKNYGKILLARLKYLTFKGEIKPGETIDHIDGNTLNNDINNLRAVPDAINRRDGGFLKKLRNKGINIAMYCPVFILEGYARMAEWKTSHTRYRYDNLTREELLRIFVGPQFEVVSPDDIMELDLHSHREY